MIIKVCGIKTIENIEFLSTLKIDMIGLNFYKPSVRYIPSKFDPTLFDTLPKTMKRVGVFVNESKNRILELTDIYRLDYAQLHGDEDSEFCEALSEKIPIIKVFRITDDFDFKTTVDFGAASYFLFDTKTILYGGSGKKFNWSILSDYQLDIPFLLSGGIGPEDVEQLRTLHHPQFAGVDINSKFESEPGIKDPSLIAPFVNAFT
ncbi:MAG: phosphoribosylanthranilate isomerase [Saprospiraceae bacterium]|nr:phosphoribosylanthranilate isomerase [Saprospiraceae bacterium]